MKLHTIRIRNFRAFHQETTITFDDLTALIGRNDAGKSSILDALDIFLNDGTLDKDDATKGGDGKDLTIVCEFDDLPDKLVIDDANPTSLSGEFLLNEDGRLEIHKTYSGHLQSPKLTGIAAFAQHPTDERLYDLLQLKNRELRNRAKELNADLKGIDTKLNAPIRQRIRESVGVQDLGSALVSLNEENARSVWDGLKKELPAFALFKSDRASTDQDPEAQDPLKAAIKEAIKSQEAELQRISEYVEAEVRKIADLTLAKLREMDPSLASELTPQFAPPRWESLFKASITGDEQIPINKRGSGVKRLILLNFFRAKAERAAREAHRSKVIYGIEEPETSQHPHNQRLLVRALTDLSANDQVIITTHTPMLARSIPDQSLRYIHVGEDRSRVVYYGGEETNEMFTRSLGVLPDHDVKIFIGVEGPNDIDFLQGISATLAAEDEDIFDLTQVELDGECIFFPLGGSTLALWVSRLRGLHRPEFHLFDRDTRPPEEPKYQAHADDINRGGNATARITSKLELENYLHGEAISRAYSEVNVELPLQENFGPFDDVPTEIARLVHGLSGSQTEWEHLSDEKRKRKESQVKRILCGRAVRHMTRARLDEVDPDGELLGWLEEIRELKEGD